MVTKSPYREIIPHVLFLRKWSLDPNWDLVGTKILINNGMRREQDRIARVSVIN